jgi:hypothetical protein
VRTLRIGLAVLPASVLAGCSLATTVRQNTDAIGRTNETVAANTVAVRESTSALGSLAKDINRTTELQKPLERVAELDTVLRDLAALNEPLRRLAELRPVLEETARLKPDLQTLANLRPTLAALAELRGPLRDVLTIRANLVEVVKLSEPLRELTKLQAPLTSVSAFGPQLQKVSLLQGPLERAANLGPPLEDLAATSRLLRMNPLWLLVGVAVLMTVSSTLGVWIGVSLATKRLMRLAAAPPRA